METSLGKDASWLSWNFQQCQYCVCGAVEKLWAQSSAFFTLIRVHICTLTTSLSNLQWVSPSYCQIFKCGHWYVMIKPAWCCCCAKGEIGCSVCEALNLAAQHVGKCFSSPGGSLCQSPAQRGADGQRVLLETGNLRELEWLKRTFLLALANFVAAC